MESLILKANAVITSPKYGKALDLKNGLRVRLDARDLKLNSGDTVAAWQGTGSGSSRETLFDKKVGDWGYPTFSSAPIKSVVFNGSNILANNYEFSPPTTTTTYVVVAKIDSSNTSNAKQDRLFTGSSTGGFQGVSIASNRLIMSGKSGNEVDVAKIPDGWFVGIFVFNEANSKLMLSNTASPVRISGVESGTQTKISIGGNINILANDGKGMHGNIAFFAQYDRVFSDIEIVQACDYYKNIFDI